MQESVILQGPIPATGIAPLVQAMGLGRQTNVVELFDSPSQVVGSLSIRSGKVLDVRFAHRHGLEALADFVAKRSGSFVVRSIHGQPATEPLGDLRSMLQQVGGQYAKVALIRELPAPTVAGTGVQQLPAATIPTVTAAPRPAPSPAAAPVVVAPNPAPVAPAPVPVAPAPVAATAPVASHASIAAPAANSNVPVIAIASAKGGVGKTTLTMNLGVALARRGLRVVLVDADPNGGISASVNAHKRIQQGVFDVLCGAARLEDVMIETRMSGLRVLPAGGAGLSFEQVEQAQGHRVAWRTLVQQLRGLADVVLIDTAGGVYGPTRLLLSLSTHVFGVLQAEPLALRASGHFDRALEGLSPAPELVGIAMNMFEMRGATSSAVLQEACDALRPGLLFDTTVPRASAINDASLRGLVAGQGELANAPSVAWTFEQLSAELLDRLKVGRTAAALDDRPLF